MPELPPRLVEELFDQAADLPPAEQAALLDERCGGDTDLRAAVEELLRLDRQAEADSVLFRSPVAETCLMAATTPAALPTNIGRYRVVRVLGEGGMGTVYEAEQDNPRRTVALKVVRAGLASEPLRKRFAREAQILGRLRHPGIAQVYDAGVAEGGPPYFAMELIAGVPLDRYAREHALDARGRLELVARVCDAVQHAHEAGVVHRDLKPGNILVEPSGQPKVLDFGVARAADTDADRRANTNYTRTGHLIGTLSYMSPEQAAADPAAVDPRSDVYTLGVILYELLAGRMPYPLDRLPLPEAVRVIREQEPPRLGVLDPDLRGDVETIVAHALEKDRARRYPSAAELAADIRRHLIDEPIRARPPSALYQFGKFTRRHKALVATTAAFLALLLGGGVVTAWQAVRLARAERDGAVQQAQRGQDVQDALARAAVLRERARASAGDPGEWAEARAMARRAEALVEGGPVAPELAERVADLLRELDEEHADRRLVARLANVRLLVVEVNAASNRFTGGRALAAYRSVFADYGLRPGSTEPGAAALLLRRPAQVRDPVVAGLGSWLTLAHHEKAAEVGWLERVLAVVDPDDWRQRLRAAFGARDLPAVEALAREADVAAQPPGALEGVAQILQANGRAEGAVQLMRRAREAHPGNFWINHTLGMALGATRPPRPDEAIRFLTVAVALQPECAGAWYNLASTCLQYDRADEAIAACRKAVALKPDYAAAHRCLGLAHEREGRLDEAIAACRKAVALGPGSAPDHFHLGNLLVARGDTPGAAAAFRAALAVDPEYYRANYNLGKILLDQGDFPGAADCYRRVIRIDPKHAPSHCNLGHALRCQGDLRGSLTAYRTGHDLGTRQKDWSYPSADWVGGCEHFLELEGRLPAVLRGEDRSVGRLDVAELCRCKELHAAAAQFFSEAFKADAKLADDFRAGPRFWAACSAARAGCGEGGDAATVTDEARAALREQARAWLRADLAGLAGCAEGGTPQDRAGVQAVLHNWQGNPALARVRDDAWIAALPPAERAAWQQLWAEVASTLAKTRGTP